jgi:hypothetical protein
MLPSGQPDEVVDRRRNSTSACPSSRESAICTIKQEKRTMLLPIDIGQLNYVSQSLAHAPCPVVSMCL